MTTEPWKCPRCKDDLNSRYFCEHCSETWSFEYLDGYWQGWDDCEDELEAIKKINRELETRLLDVKVLLDPSFWTMNTLDKVRDILKRR